MSFAEFESDLIRTRVKAGLQAAKARGVKLGRPQVVTSEVIQMVLHLRYQKNLSIRAIGKAMTPPISKTSVERILRNYERPK